MNRLGRIVASCALAVFLAGCDKLPDVFEDVGNDPHPPSLTLLAIGLGTPDPEPEPTPPAPALDLPRAVTYFPPDAVVTVRPYDAGANTLTLRVAYADAAADLTAITLRDTGGPNGGDFELPEFTNTSGTLESSFVFDPNTVPGPHSLEIWAQDDNGSRSAKIIFTVIVESY